MPENIEDINKFRERRSVAPDSETRGSQRAASELLDERKQKTLGEQVDKLARVDSETGADGHLLPDGTFLQNSPYPETKRAEVFNNKILSRKDREAKIEELRTSKNLHPGEKLRQMAELMDDTDENIAA